MSLHKDSANSLQIVIKILNIEIINFQKFY